LLLPNAVGLPAHLAVWAIGAATLLAVVVPYLASRRLRQGMLGAEREGVLRAWHLRQIAHDAPARTVALDK
jgi:hypothetical protein